MLRWRQLSWTFHYFNLWVILRVPGARIPDDGLLATDRRRIGPKLEAAGLGWVTFQVMRRTHSSLMNDLKVEPKIVADQLGHTLDVGQNIYTQSASLRRKEAVDSLESALLNA